MTTPSSHSRSYEVKMRFFPVSFERIDIDQWAAVYLCFVDIWGSKSHSLQLSYSTFEYEKMYSGLFSNTHLNLNLISPNVFLTSRRIDWHAPWYMLVTTWPQVVLTQNRFFDIDFLGQHVCLLTSLDDRNTMTSKLSLHFLIKKVI